MSQVGAQEHIDSDYLSHGLAWVRSLLERHLPKEQEGSTVAVGRWHGIGEQRRALPMADPTTIRANFDTTAETDPAPAAVQLFERLGLSPFERDMLVLCAAPELDSAIGSLLARVQGNPHLSQPTLALALSVLPDPAWEAIAPDGALRFWRLVRIDDSSDPLTSRPLRIDERILHQMKGLWQLDERLAESTHVRHLNSPNTLPPSQADKRDEITRVLQTANNQGQLPIVQLIGPAESGRLVAQAVCGQIGLDLATVSADRLPRSASDLSEFARLWSREFRLGPLALLIDNLSEIAEPERAGVRGVLDQLWGPVFISTADVLSGGSTWTFAVEVRRPTPPEQSAAWIGSSDVTLSEANELAGHFDLEIADIERASLVADSMDDETATSFERVWSATRTSARHGLDQHARSVDARATWSDLVLPEREVELLRLLVAQATNRMRVYEDWGFGERMNRGRGVTALFAGPSGTGKTMAAEVIANHLGLLLYAVDLAAVVSKWVGETAKSLRQLFDAAERSGAVLFFDEADAVFGKRTDVKDSHDKYANTETDYLLQRLESFRGVAILATNKRSNIDRAFLRRLTVAINFPFPGTSERRLIWRGALPENVPRDPVDPVDIEKLSQFEMSGGDIQSAALTGSFLAASDGGALGMRHLVAGTRNQQLKQERTIGHLADASGGAA